MWNSIHYIQFPLESMSQQLPTSLQNKIPFLFEIHLLLFPSANIQVAPTVQWYSYVRLYSSCWLWQAFVCVLAGFWSCGSSLTVCLTVSTLATQVHNFPWGDKMAAWCICMVLAFGLKWNSPPSARKTAESVSILNRTVKQASNRGWDVTSYLTEGS